MHGGLHVSQTNLSFPDLLLLIRLQELLLFGHLVGEIFATRLRTWLAWSTMQADLSLAPHL